MAVLERFKKGQGGSVWLDSMLIKTIVEYEINVCLLNGEVSNELIFSLKK